MSTTEIEVRQPRPQANAAALPAKVQYAKELANSGLLPPAYRKNPGNVLFAVEFGEMLGLAPMAAITGVHVIDGKPTASAGLISALVRRAGHKLRLKGDGRQATCQIMRSDDPEFTFEVTWTLRRNDDGNPSAEEAGLLGKNTWKSYPAAMLKSRAITQCARDACEEALFGLHYTPEELGAEVDEDGVVVGEAVEPTPEQVWLAAALEMAPKHASLDACAAAWTRVVTLVGDGKLTREEGGTLQDALRPRIAELKAAAPAESADVADAEVADLEPDDPWADKVADIASDSEAEAIIAEAGELLDRDEIDAARYQQIGNAVEAQLARISQKQAA